MFTVNNEKDNEKAPLGSPYARNECHIDPYVARLTARIESELTQGFEEDENGNRKRKPVGVIHLGGHYPDPVMLIRAGLKGPLLHHLCGEICVRVHVECIGAGPEIDITAPLQPIEGPRGEKCCDKEDDEWCYYDFEVTIPRGHFKPKKATEETEAYDPGCGEVCCFVTTLTTKDRCGHPGHIGCWSRGPCVMIHQEPEHVT